MINVINNVINNDHGMEAVVFLIETNMKQKTTNDDYSGQSMNVVALCSGQRLLIY